LSEIKTLSIDIETYSDIDLSKCGVYKYAESENFEILLFGYAVNCGEVQVVDLIQCDEVPGEIIKALADETVSKWAFNASFERICLSVWLRKNYPEHFYSYSIKEDRVANNNQDYSILVNEIYRLRDEKEAALAKNAGFASQKQRMAEMTKFLKEQKGTIEEYDEQIVRKLIEKITVHDERVTVEFKSAMTVDIKV